ncbi:Metallo-dependent phosphatase [Hypoxylon sp. FL0543]|nr:Metallo-dependent phosphatase [Hypoxylon sp. FL0543]
MGRRESPPSRKQRRKQHQRRKLATVGTTLAIAILVLLYYARFHAPSPTAPMAHEIDTSAHPALKKPTLVATLPPSALPKPGAGPDSPRLVVIGDVHGQLDALDALLAKVGYSPARGDQVVFTGDMVSKGPDSGGVVDRAMSMHAWGVRGNHEDRVLRAWAKHHRHERLNGENSGSTPTTSGEEPQGAGGEEKGEADEEKAQKPSKSETLDRSTAAGLTPKQISWLANLPVILRLGTISPYYGDVVVVHAGLVPGVPLEKQDPWAAMNMRTLLPPSHSHSHSHSPDVEARDSAETSSHKPTFQPSEGREGHPWSKIWNQLQKELDKEHRTTVVYGHDAKVGLSVRRYAFGLDSSCVKGGDLTALVFEPVSASAPAESAGQDSQGEEVAERVKHGITHRIVSVSCEAAVSDDDRGGEKKDKKKAKENE